MTGRMAGQTINDRLLAAKHSLAGQGLAKSVCKATTEEMIGPKKKHLDYLVHCTNEPNVSIPQLANLLIERSQNTNWVVVYKALITVHHMMCYGNERFTQYLASSNSTFQLSNFLDRSGVQGILNIRTGYDMSPFIRRYSRYLNEKALSYRTVAFDFCKVKRGKEDGMLRTMNADKLLKTLPVLQNQLDALLEFDCSANDLTNGVINMCFMLLFRDLIRLFACYNDGIINLLEKFFDMNKKQCKEALDIYKKFLIRMDKVAEFLKVAENVGIDKGDIPDLTKAPSSLLDALEQHLSHLEGKKTSQSSSSQSQSSNQKNVKSGVTALSSTSNAFGNVVANGRFDTPANGIDENLKLQVLAEEEAAMNQFKSKVNSPPASVNPFLSNSSSSSSKTISAQSASEIDLFVAEPVAPAAVKASDDLLQLSNPFADAFAQPQPVNTSPFMQSNNIWMANGNAFVAQPSSPVVSNGAFVSENNFASVFGTTETKTAEETKASSSFNPFLVEDPDPPLLLDIDSSDPNPIHHVLSYFQKDSNFSETNSQNSDQQSDVAKISVKDGPNFQCDDSNNNDFTTDNKIPCVFTATDGLPVVSHVIDGYKQMAGLAFDALGGVLQPVSAGQNPAPSANNNNSNSSTNNNTLNQQTSSPLLTGDLESSLASLAENLTINSRTVPMKGVQWNSPKNGSKTNNWTPQPMSATTGAGYKPMNQSMSSPPLSMQTTLQPQMYPQIPPMMGMRPIVTSPAMIPQMTPLGVVPNPTNQMGQQSLLFH